MRSGQEVTVQMHLRQRRVLVLLSAAAVLAGCTGGGPDSGGSSGGVALATLTVHIGLFGGPARLGGGMALSNSPAQNENVTAVDAAGVRSRTQTDANGVAMLSLAPGRYTVFSTYCGTGPHRVVLSANRTTRVQIDCPIP
jgi:hypothetical protein